VLEYIDGTGDVDRGEVAEAYAEPITELGLTGGGGMEVSRIAVCDTVLERPRAKSPGREGREEEDTAGEVDAVACGCALDTSSGFFARKIGKRALTVN
jgi:hypothetical protein